MDIYGIKFIIELLLVKEINFLKVPEFCLQTHNFDKNYIKVILPTQSKKKSIIVLTNIYKFLSGFNPRSQIKALSTIICFMEFNPNAEFFRERFLNSSQSIKFTYTKKMTSTNPKSTKLINRDDVNEMIENAIRRHNRRSTIISAILGWILIGGYSFGLFHVVQNI